SMKAMSRAPPKRWLSAERLFTPELENLGSNYPPGIPGCGPNDYTCPLGRDSCSRVFRQCEDYFQVTCTIYCIRDSGLKMLKSIIYNSLPAIVKNYRTIFVFACGQQPSHVS